MSTIERRLLAPVVVTSSGPELDIGNAAYIGLAQSKLSYSTIVLTDSDAPDSLSWRLYGDENLWWIIAAFNGIVDAYTEFTAGKRIRIPRLDEVIEFMNNNSRQNTGLESGGGVGTSGVI